MVGWLAGWLAGWMAAATNIFGQNKCRMMIAIVQITQEKNDRQAAIQFGALEKFK